MIATLCPSCGNSVEVPEEYLHQPVNCGGCNIVFTALPSEEADAGGTNDHTQGGAAAEPIYYFSLRGTMFGMGTVIELTANKLLLQSDAIAMEALPRSGGPALPLASLVDFSKPWRTSLPGNRQPVQLPSYKPNPLEVPLGDPLQPHWAGDYYVRMAGSSHNFPRQVLKEMIANPPFRRDDAWKIEVKNANFSGPYVPLTSLLDLRDCWPETVEVRPAGKQRDMAHLHIYLFSAEAQKGPYLLEQIRGMWQQGAITADALWWTEGMDEWEEIQRLLIPTSTTQEVSHDPRSDTFAGSMELMTKLAIRAVESLGWKMESADEKFGIVKFETKSSWGSWSGISCTLTVDEIAPDRFRVSGVGKQNLRGGQFLALDLGEANGKAQRAIDAMRRLASKVSN